MEEKEHLLVDNKIMDKTRDNEIKISHTTTTSVPLSVYDNSSSGDQEEDQQPGKLSLMSYFLGLVFLPITILAAPFTVKQNQEMVILNFGRFVDVVKEPGCHCSNFWGRELIPISKAKNTTELPVTKVIDKNGNPVMVSGVVFYYFKNTKKAALDVLDPQAFVKDQATAVLKQIVSQYPYEHHQTGDTSDNDDKSDEDLPCLKNDAQVISAALVKELQKRVHVAGAQIDTFRFNEVSYAPEVSVGLLKRQQAEAIITARTTLVDGAVRIASSAVSRLERKGVHLQMLDKTRLVSNLLTVICSEEQVQPVLMLGTT